MKRHQKVDPSRTDHGSHYDQGFQRITVGLLTSGFRKGLSHCLQRNVLVTRIPKGANDQQIAEQLGAVPHKRLSAGSLTWLELQAELGWLVSSHGQSGARS